MSHLLQNELLPKLSPDQLLRALDLTSVLADDGVAQTVLSQELTFREIGVAPVDLDAKVLHDYMRSIRHLVRELQLGSGDHAVIVNGRVSNLFPSLLSLSLTNDDRLLALLAPGSLWRQISKPYCLTSSVSGLALWLKH